MSEEKQSYECPECHELCRFERRGKRKYLTCNECGERVGLSKVPDEFIDLIEVERKPDHKEDPGPFGIQSEQDILIGLLDDFEITGKQRKVILGRMEKYGSLPPEDLLNLLVALGQKREVASLITQDYSNLLVKQRQQKEAILKASGQMPERERRPPPPPEPKNPLMEAIQIIKAMKELDPPKEDNSEVHELKKELERMREERNNDRLEQMEKNMQQQMQIMATQMERTEGFKEDFYRLANSGIKEYFGAVKEGKTSHIGSGERMEKTITAVASAKDKNMRAGRFRSEKRAETSSDDIADLVDSRYIEDLSGDENEIIEEEEEDPFTDADDGGESNE